MSEQRYQLRKLDGENWQIWAWQDGGERITRGRYAGQQKQAKWKPLESYHPDLDYAAKALLKLATLDRVPTNSPLDTDAVLAAVEAARTDVLAAVAAVTPDEFKKQSKRGRKPKAEAADGS